MVCCALVVYAVEPESSGFATFNDAMWWALVSFTTVGYGDLFPVTFGGRFAAVLLMIGGVALIGTLAATLGSFFSGGGDDEESTSADQATDSVDAARVQLELLAEVKSMRAEIAEMRMVGGGNSS
jgi:voltage-gated potassium channel